VADELADRLDAYAETVLATGAASSMAVAVTDGERTLASRTYGAPDGAMFQFGSIGKSFTAIVALQLAERGLIDLHAPVTDVLPWFAVGGLTEPITAHQLLTHSSGLIQGAEIATGSNYDVVALADTAVGFTPGEHFWYSNVGYRVLGLMLERVTAQSYPRLVSERILELLGMDGSEPWIVQEMRPRLAQATVPAFDDRPWRPEHGLVPATWIDSAEADGCVCSSGADLAIYLRALMTRDERLLPADRWAAMLAPHVEVDQDDEGEHYGYGIRIGPEDFGHGGGMIGTGSLMVVTYDGLGAVAMACGYMGGTAMARAGLALAAGGEPEPFALELAEPLEDDGSCPEQWRPFLGHYRAHNAWLTNFRVVAKEGGLRWVCDHLSDERTPLTPLAGDDFRVGERDWSPERLRFDHRRRGPASAPVRSALHPHVHVDRRTMRCDRRQAPPPRAMLPCQPER
jgi:CubicO group peptidase (beta-lactamase class C family)